MSQHNKYWSTQGKCRQDAFLDFALQNCKNFFKKFLSTSRKGLSILSLPVQTSLFFLFLLNHFTLVRSTNLKDCRTTWEFRDHGDLTNYPHFLFFSHTINHPPFQVRYVTLRANHSTNITAIVRPSLLTVTHFRLKYAAAQLILDSL